jgi:hypothetical protein
MVYKCTRYDTTTRFGSFSLSWLFGFYNTRRFRFSSHHSDFVIHTLDSTTNVQIKRDSVDRCSPLTRGWISLPPHLHLHPNPHYETVCGSVDRCSPLGMDLIIDIHFTSLLPFIDLMEEGCEVIASPYGDGSIYYTAITNCSYPSPTRLLWIPYLLSAFLLDSIPFHDLRYDMTL